MNNYFFNQALLTDGWHENVRVEIDDHGLFSQVTKHSTPENTDTVLDCVIPTMPNCHSHVFQRVMAGLTEYKTAENDSFWSWRHLMYKTANQLDAKQLYHVARYCYSEMLQAGYTSVCEFHYIHRDLEDNNNTENMSLAIINAAHDVGIQLTMLPVLYTQAHIDGSPLSELQQRFKMSTVEYISLYHSLEKRLFSEQNMGICFHSLRAVSLKQINTVLDALNIGQPIHIHIAEQDAEIQQVLKHSGKRPVELLFENFDVNENWCLVHATHLNDIEIKMVSQSKAIAGLCPMTEANLGDGVFPLKEYIHNNGGFAIGSDSQILINPFQEMQILEYSQRLMRQQRVIASTKQTHNVGTLLWNNSVSGGAKVCHLPIAGLKVGQLANWISLDTENPLLTGLNGAMCLDSLIFADNNIKTDTYVKGIKLDHIHKNIVQNYKNTLKSLR